MSGRGLYASADGRLLRFSNLEKVLYPATGFTKGDVIRYYRRVAPYLLTHLRGRGITLKRYPGGVDEPYFFQKSCPSHRPNWLQTQTHGEVSYCVVDHLSSLLWMANLAAIELHAPLSVQDDPTVPSLMVFDLDPGAPAGIVECARIAIRVRKQLESVGLRSFLKTSGMKGLQVYVPLNTPGIDYGMTKSFSRSIAELLERKYPDEITSRMSKKLRPGKVFIDWSQNDENKTTISVYSLRAAETPSVSTPISWDEAERLRRPLSFSPEQVIKRLKEEGDLFEALLSMRQKLPAARPVRDLKLRTLWPKQHASKRRITRPPSRRKSARSS